MNDLICRKTMRACDTPGMCSPFGGCSVAPARTRREGADAMSCRELRKAASNVLNACDNYGTAECLRGWIDMLRNALSEASPAPGCIDSLCPCQDGALCHYVDGPDGTMALAAPSAEPSEPVAWRYKPTIGSPWSLSDDGYYISCKRTQGYIVESLGVIDPTAPAPPAPTLNPAPGYCKHCKQYTIEEPLPAPSAEPTVPAASVNWLLEQCEEYQRRAHEAEREVLALRAQIEQIGGGR